MLCPCDFPAPCRRARRPHRGRPLRRLILPLLLALVLHSGPAGAQGAAGDDRTSYLRQLKEGDPEARRHALLGLADNGDASTVPDVAAALRDSDLVVRKLAERTLWSIWSRSGDEELDELLKAGSTLLARGRASQSVPIFSRVIERAPEFAEGWNKRATAYYEIGEYEKSLADIDETLKRNPYHYGALSGGGLCLLELERYDQALRFFDRALEINPNLENIVELKKALLKRNRKPVI